MVHDLVNGFFFFFFLVGFDYGSDFGIFMHVNLILG